jgi:hypothetical protein
VRVHRFGDSGCAYLSVGSLFRISLSNPLTVFPCQHCCRFWQRLSRRYMGQVIGVPVIVVARPIVELRAEPQGSGSHRNLARSAPRQQSRLVGSASRVGSAGSVLHNGCQSGAPCPRRNTRHRRPLRTPRASLGVTSFVPSTVGAADATAIENTRLVSALLALNPSFQVSIPNRRRNRGNVGISGKFILDTTPGAKMLAPPAVDIGRYPPSGL